MCDKTQCDMYTSTVSNNVSTPLVTQLKQLHELDLSQLQFVGDSLKILRQEVHQQVCAIPALSHAVHSPPCKQCQSTLPE